MVLPLPERALGDADGPTTVGTTGDFVVASTLELGEGVDGIILGFTLGFKFELGFGVGPRTGTGVGFEIGVAITTGAMGTLLALGDTGIIDGLKKNGNTLGDRVVVGMGGVTEQLTWRIALLTESAT